ncbi:melatonin receptor type 1B-like [Stylophora pistillata]|uniref:melatonin receptor type 1B-like n=1 Tax=Stylophora pistillata TaxID=50429 RepID=UPI000C04AE12|nr:melatonin receptor type 1B-like [Stylophora pistillata]
MTLIITICRTRVLRTRTNMFILNQACADLGVALFCMPFSIITCYTRNWIFGDSICQLNGFVNILFEASSLFTLTSISIEKYFSIVKPMRVVITAKKTVTMVIMTWLTALGLAALPLTGFIAFEFKPGSTQCGVQIPANIGQTIYSFVVLVVAFLMPLCIMGFCYVNIFLVVKKHNIRRSRMSLSSINSESSLSTQSQIALTVFMMLIVFILCWSPYFAYMVYLTAHQVKSPDAFARSLGLASYWFAFLNSCINPFVYGFRNPLIRRPLYLMCCNRKFRRSRERYSLRKAHQHCDPFLGTPLPLVDCDKTSPPYPAFINVVALTEEDITSPNEGIDKATVDRGTQRRENWKILSFQDLPHVYIVNGVSSTTNQVLSISVKQQTFPDHAYDVTCSSCSSVCSDCNRVVTNSNEVIMCSSMLSVEDSGLCSECACAFDCESSTSKTCIQCEQDDLESNSCPSILSHAKEVQSHRVLHLVDHSENKMKYPLQSAKEKTRMSFTIGWMESHL